MAIVLQNAGKQGFFVISARNQRKNLRSFNYFLCKTNPILSAVGGLQMNVNTLVTMDYENISDWTLGENKPNSNPIKANFFKIPNECKLTYNKRLQKKRRFRSPKKQTQFKPNQSQSKPILKRMNVNFCAAGYYESKPTFPVRKGRPNNPNPEFATAWSSDARIVTPGG